MRGDSLRDLYAKVIAVVGLGVLAGAGALVDYWPSGGVLPRVAADSGRATLTGPLPVPSAATVAELRRRDGASASRMQTLAAVPAQPSLTLTEESDRSAALPVSHHIDLTRSAAVALAAPPAVPSSSATSSVETTNDLAVNDETGNSFTNSSVLLSAVSLSEDDGDGVIVGAVKKTRDSIVGAGRKTGASIFDAFRFVGGAMKKALPGT